MALLWRGRLHHHNATSKRTENDMALMGQEIGKQLCAALGLPKNTVGFTLRCYALELVTVECEYYPEGKLLTSALAQFTLEPRAVPAEDERHPSEVIGFDAWMRERTQAAHAAYMGRHALVCGYTTMKEQQ
jgi:hypothetical protein